MSNLKSRISRIEDVARPIAEAAARLRERRINTYIAECRKRGLETTRKHAEEANAFMEREMNRLSHLPRPERLRQSAINYSVKWYREKTGKSEEEARETLTPYLEEYLNHEQPEIENQENRNGA
jgi:hypothetical protein